MSNPKSGSQRTPHNIEAIVECAEIITEIIKYNRETINLIFKNFKEILKEEDDSDSSEFVGMNKAYKEGE